MLSKPRILVVEDESGIADTLQYVLATDGFAPVVCGTRSPHGAWARMCAISPPRTRSRSRTSSRGQRPVTTAICPLVTDDAMD